MSGVFYHDGKHPHYNVRIHGEGAVDYVVNRIFNEIPCYTVINFMAFLASDVTKEGAAKVFNILKTLSIEISELVVYGVELEDDEIFEVFLNYISTTTKMNKLNLTGLTAAQVERFGAICVNNLTNLKELHILSKHVTQREINVLLPTRLRSKFIADSRYD